MHVLLSAIDNDISWLSSQVFAQADQPLPVLQSGVRHTPGDLCDSVLHIWAVLGYKVATCNQLSKFGRLIWRKILVLLVADDKGV